MNFQLYTKERPDSPIELQTGKPLYQSINLRLPWKFLVHGYFVNPATSWLVPAKEEFFKKGDYNIVYVNWTVPATQDYLLSLLSTMVSGRILGELIIYLSVNGVSLDDIHIIGHSLGSHLSGSAGEYVRDNARKISRITGLDPAGPFFEYRGFFGPDETEALEPAVVEALKQMNPDFFQNIPFLISEQFRLSKEDANFVDIVHTNGGFLGLSAIIGHCDFIVNDGERQPGCTSERCSHKRSEGIFIESINQNNFVAKECSSYEEYETGVCANRATAIIGEMNNPDTRGIFYLKTSSASPFGLGNI